MMQSNSTSLTRISLSTSAYNPLPGTITPIQLWDGLGSCGRCIQPTQTTGSLSKPLRPSNVCVISNPRGSSGS